MRRRGEFAMTAEEGEKIFTKLSVQPLIHKGVAYVLAPARCGVLKCGRIAITLDCFFPFHTEENRCCVHASERSQRTGPEPGRGAGR